MKKIIAVLLVVCLLFVAGCTKKTSSADSAKSTSANMTKKPSDAAVSATALQQRRTVALKALSDVMLNNAEFVDSTSGQKLFLKDLNGGITGMSDKTDIYKPTNFAVVDLDGDGIPEVVVEVHSSPESDDGREVLHYQADGTVEGVYFGIRAMSSVAKNGLFSASGGAADNYVEKIRFIGDTYDVSDQIYSATGLGSSISSYVYDVPVSQDTCYTQMGNATVDEVTWYIYSEALISKWVTNRPASADPKPVLLNTALVARQDYLDGLSALAKRNPDLPSNDPKYLGPTNAQVLSYYQDWDKELNKIYSLLENRLPTNQMNALRADERQWMSIRDKDGAQAYQGWISGGSDVADATLQKNQALGDVTKNRTFYLIDLYFGDTSQPSTTSIIQKYGLKK